MKPIGKCSGIEKILRLLKGRFKTESVSLPEFLGLSFYKETNVRRDLFKRFVSCRLTSHKHHLERYTLCSRCRIISQKSFTKGSSADVMMQKRACLILKDLQFFRRKKCAENKKGEE